MTKSTKQPNKVQQYFLENPEMATIFAGMRLQKDVPEDLRKAVGEDAIKRALDGDVTVWAELMVAKPELFRERPLSLVEDLAWEELLTNGTPAPRGEPSSAPSSATAV
jgi:hypothetical protein